MVNSPATNADGQRSLESVGYTQELNRSVSTVDLLVYGLVFVVPIAPWAIFGTVYNSASGMVPLVYVIGLIAMIFTALAYAQMAKSFPLAGSVFSYVGRGIHPSLGFFAGQRRLAASACSWFNPLGVVPNVELKSDVSTHFADKSPYQCSSLFFLNT